MMLVAVADAADISVYMVDGKCVARCKVLVGEVSLPANVVFDLGLPVPLVVHETAAGLLNIGSGAPVTLAFGDFTLANLPAYVTAVDMLNTLNYEHAEALRDIPAVALVGLPALANYAPQLDLAAGRLRLLPAVPPESDLLPDGAEALDESRRAAVLPYAAEPGGYFLTARTADGFDLRTRFATTTYDTLIDAITTDLAGAPGGELDELFLGPINIAEYVAFRPVDLSTGRTTPLDLSLGTNLLAHFRVTIDQNNQRMLWEAVRPPAFPEVDRQFFVAYAEQDDDVLAGLLREYPQHRFAATAAGLLLQRRLEEHPADLDAVDEALTFRAAAVHPERRARMLISLADEIVAGGHPQAEQLTTLTLQNARQYAAADLNAVADYQISARLGRLALERGELTEARRRLLSAAFGMPMDPYVNLALGDLYTELDRPLRAWSRYVQAILADEPPPPAYTALNLINNDPAFRAQHSMADAVLMLEGRILEYHAPTRFPEDRSAGEAHHLRLVELFTCVDQPATQAAQLAFGAIGEYYEEEPVAFLAYHLAAGAPDPLITNASAARAEFYGIAAVPTLIINGVTSRHPAGSVDNVGGIFAHLRDYTAAAPSIAVELDGNLSWDAGVLVGEIGVETTTTAVQPLALHAFVVEPVLMAPAANGLLLHHHVVRAALSPATGWPVAASSERLVVAIQADRGELSTALAATVSDYEARQGISFYMKPVYLDPASLYVVAFVQDMESREVVAAASFAPSEKVP